MDRNEAARLQFKQQQAMCQAQQQFRQALAAGTVTLIDRIGQPVKEGDLVIYHPPWDFVYEIAEIKPILDPRVAPGNVEVTLTCRAPVHFTVGPPIMTMIRVGHQHEPGHASLDEVQQAAPAAAAPATEATNDPEGHDIPEPSDPRDDVHD